MTTNAIYMIVDRRFLPIGRAQALSLALIWDVDIHLFVEDASVTSCPPVDNPRVHFHINEIRANLPEGLPTSSKWPIIVFSRNYVPALLGNYDRLIYMDVDILCLKADHSIWKIDLPSGIGAVRDVVHLDRAPLDTGMQLQDWLSAIGVTKGRYFNSGMLLIDPKRWDVGRLERLLTGYYENRNVNAIKSQDFLNHAFDGEWVELSPRWNWQPAYLELGLEPILDPVVVHFCNRVKPWFYPDKPGLSRQRRDVEQAFFKMFVDAGVSPAELAEKDDRHSLKKAGQWLRNRATRAGLTHNRERRMRDLWKRRSQTIWSHLHDTMAKGGYADLCLNLPMEAPKPVLWFDGRAMRELRSGDPTW